MSMEVYERKLTLADIYQKLTEAEADIAKGAPLLDGEEVLRGLRQIFVKCKRI